jgi:hypothetical protein
MQPVFLRRACAVMLLALGFAGCSDGSDGSDDTSSRNGASTSSSTRVAAVTSTSSVSTSTSQTTQTVSSTTVSSSDTFGPPTGFLRPLPLPTAPPPPEPVTTNGAAARRLRYASSCDPAAPSVAVVTLAWQPAGNGQQLVAVAIRSDGFDRASYGVSAPLPPDQSGYAVRAVEPGGVYYWRVMTRVADAWVASEPATFTGPTCVLDQPSSP